MMSIPIATRDARVDLPPGLHDHVRGNFEEDVERKEDCQTCRVLGDRQVEVFRETEKVGVT
jgi:hypothetical protein